MPNGQHNWIQRAVARHEAAHAVTSYWYNVPSTLIRMGGGQGNAGEWYGDQDGVWVAMSFLVHNGKNWARFLTSLAVVCHAGEAVDLHMNQLPAPVAAARSAGDKEFLEMFIAFVEGIYLPANPQQVGFFQNLRGQLAQSAAQVNIGLVQQHQYRTAVDAVADRLLAQGILLEHEWRPIIDTAGVPANLPVPPALDHGETALHAHFLWRKRGGGDGNADSDWFTAERGLRVAKLSGG